VGEAKEVIPVAMGLVLAFIVARIPETRMRATVIAVASVVLGFLATWINSESLVHVLFDIPQVALAAVVGLMLLGKFKPEWVRSESPATSHPDAKQ
jgi:hypothetical protein